MSGRCDLVDGIATLLNIFVSIDVPLQAFPKSGQTLHLGKMCRSNSCHFILEDLAFGEFDLYPIFSCFEFDNIGVAAEVLIGSH